MSRKSFRQAINEALRQEMRRDERVILMGEDIAGGQGGSANIVDAWGGVMGVTKGLYTEFGPERVFDTPITEASYVGAAVGAAATGLRPVVELMFVDFLGCCLDQLLNQVSKFRYMFGGKTRSPLVVRAMFGAGQNAAAQHSQSLYPILTHIPGLKVVVPSSPYEAKGLLIEAIRDDDPVIFLEHKVMYDDEGEVPDESYAISFNEANVLAEGKDVTLVAFGRMVSFASQAAAQLKKEGITCTIIDPRCTSPFDKRTVLDYVAQTGRLVIIDESSPRCNMACDVSAMVAEEGFSSLKSPILRVTPPHTPVPFSTPLEKAYIPSVEKIVSAVKASMG